MLLISVFPAAPEGAHTLEDKRRLWHADLDNLLQGHLDQEVKQVAMRLAS